MRQKASSWPGLGGGVMAIVVGSLWAGGNKGETGLHLPLCLIGGLGVVVVVVCVCCCCSCIVLVVCFSSRLWLLTCSVVPCCVVLMLSCWRAYCC